MGHCGKKLQCPGRCACAEELRAEILEKQAREEEPA